MNLNEWVVYTQEHDAFYGAEGKCYVMAVFDNDRQVGKEYPYVTAQSYHDYSFRRHGLQLKIMKTKEYVKPTRRLKDDSKYETVIIKKFDRFGEELLGLDRDHRAVYSSTTKGRYIKTRSEGRVYLTLDQGIPTIHYRGGRPVPPTS